MSTDLSWFDRNIIPLTKNYRDFIKAKESTPPERWDKNGKRKFSDKEKKYLQIYQNRVKKVSAALIVPEVPEVPVIPVTEKKVVIKNPEMENQIDTGNENEIIADNEKQNIVGKTTRYDLSGKIAEVKEFTSEESYLKAIQQQVGRTNFKNETLIRNPVLLKKVDDLLALDRKSILPLEHYIDKVKNEIKHEIKDTLSQEVSVKEKEIIGRISQYDLFGKKSGDKEYTSIESYLKALQDQVGKINFKHETLLRDPELLKKIDDLLFGSTHTNSIEHYIEMVRSEKVTEHIPENIQDLNYKIPDEKQEIVGKLHFYGGEGEIVEVIKYTSAENYLQALGKELDIDINGFKFDTVLRDPALLKAVDDRVYGVYGEDNPNSLEHYINLVKNEDRFERYKNIPGTFFEASKEFIDTISSEKLLELKSSKVYNVEDEMRADNFSTISLLREDIEKISEVLAERGNTVALPMYPDHNLDTLAEKLREHYEIEQDPGIPFNRTTSKEFLRQAVEVANMPDELRKPVIQFINVAANPPVEPARYDYWEGNMDEMDSSFDKANENYKNVEVPEFNAKINTLAALLSQNNIYTDKLPKLDEFEANYFAALVGELKRNFPEEISRIQTDQFNTRDATSFGNQQDVQQLQYHKDQLKYLGFGEGEKLRNDLKHGIDSHQNSFEVQAVANKTQLGNTVNFALKYARLDQGDIILNSYDGNLTNGKGEHISQNFKVTKDNHFSAKEAINLLEGRAVKIAYTNPLTDLREQAFVKLNLSEEKNPSGNYNFQTFPQNYGLDIRKIVERSNLIFERPELKEKAIMSFEKGDIIKVTMNVENKITEGHAVLNPQYRTLNLYDSEMNRINTNKPIQGMEQIQAHEKSNVRQQSLSRGI